MTTMWTVLRANGACPCSLSCYVASLLAPKFRFSCRAQISLGARNLLKQTTAFTHLLWAYILRPLALRWSSKFYIPSSLGARCLLKQTTTFAQCRDFGSISMDPINNQCMGKRSRNSVIRSSLTKIPKYSNTKNSSQNTLCGKMVSYPNSYTTNQSKLIKSMTSSDGHLAGVDL